ncbi:MAG: pilus assembly protein PilP [Candidatus Brocadiales bacterium]|nr:pilus assembly protein PilP [Candidatus Brocadiales bacterium]
MKINFIKYLFGILLIMFSIGSFADEELPINPFSPIFTETEGEGDGGADTYKKGDDSSKNIHPLQKFPVKKYILMGVLSSEKGKVAMIRSTGRQEYFIHIDDLIGSDGGTVSEINGRGIEVTEKERVVFLGVRNRSVSDEDHK